MAGDERMWRRFTPLTEDFTEFDRVYEGKGFDRFLLAAAVYVPRVPCAVFNEERKRLFAEHHVTLRDVRVLREAVRLSPLGLAQFEDRLRELRWLESEKDAADGQGCEGRHEEDKTVRANTDSSEFYF